MLQGDLIVKVVRVQILNLFKLQDLQVSSPPVGCIPIFKNTLPQIQGPKVFQY